MAWTNVPLGDITFGLFSGSTAAATVTVAATDLQLFRYKKLSPDTITVDFRIGKAFIKPTNAAVTGITMELSVPFSSVFFPAGLNAMSEQAGCSRRIGTPISFPVSTSRS